MSGISSVFSIINFTFDEEISGIRKGIKKRISERLFRRKVKKYCVLCFRKHNGTVLTNPIFSQWLENDKTIGRLFKYSGETHVNQTDCEYIESELKNLRENIDYQIDGKDISATEDFFRDLLILFREYREKYISDDTRQIIHNIDNNSKETQNTVLSSKEEIIAEVKNSKGVLSSVQEYNIFHVLNKSFWKGDFAILKEIKPLIGEKSKSLDLWLDIVICEAMYDGYKYRTNISLSDIDNISIREDAIRKIVVFSYLEGKIIKDNSSTVDGELKELLEKIKDGDSWLFDESKEEKDNVIYYSLKPYALLKKEKETVNMLQVISLFKKEYIGTATVIESIINSDNFNFLLELLRDTRSYLEELSKCENETKAIEISTTLSKELLNKKDIYLATNSYIQIIYWKTVLQSVLISEKNRIEEIIHSIPEEIQEEIKESILIARIQTEHLTQNDFYHNWEKTENYDLLCAYICTLNSSQAYDFIMKIIPKAMDNTCVYLTLVELFIRDNNEKEASILLKNHNDVGANYAEYYVDCIQIWKRVDEVEILERKWLNHELKYIRIQTDFVVAQIFYDWFKYEVCLQVIKSLELKGFGSKRISRLKALALVKNNRAKEGLALLNDLSSDYKDDIAVIGNILVCSLELRREISDEILDAAKMLNNSEILMYLALVYERQGDIPSAKRYFWRALLSDNIDKSQVYGLYWAFSIKHLKDDCNCNFIDEESCIIIKNTDKNVCLTIGILGKDYVEANRVVHGITIVNTNDAIKNGWLKKKLGEKIEFDEEEYEVVEIISMDTCFSRICLEKLVQSGAAKALTAPRESTPEQLQELFKTFLKNNISTDNKVKDLYNDYRNLSKLPNSLFVLSQYSNLKYLVFVYCYLKDPSILIREWINYDFNNTNTDLVQGYVLSFSSLILFYVLQVPVESLAENKVYIPKSMILEIRSEKDNLISEYKQDGCGTIAIVNDKLQMFTNSEESKRELVGFAIDLLEYAENIQAIECNKDFEFESISEPQIQPIFGTPDLDALSICKEYDYSLISFEVLLTDINALSGNKGITPIGLLNIIEEDTLVLIDYLMKLVECHMMSVLDTDSLARIVDSDSDEVFEAWKKYTSLIEEQNDDYKDWLRDFLTRVSQKYQEKTNREYANNDIENALFDLVMKLLEREIHLKTSTTHDEDGNIILRTYMRVFDKKEQRYIEEFDNIIESSICIESLFQEEDNTD